jgi:hypothetical protein
MAQTQLAKAMSIVEVLLDLEQDTEELRQDIEHNGISPEVDTAYKIMRQSISRMSTDYETVWQVIEMQRSGVEMTDVLRHAPRCDAMRIQTD